MLGVLVIPCGPWDQQVFVGSLARKDARACNDPFGHGAPFSIRFRSAARCWYASLIKDVKSAGDQMSMPGALLDEAVHEASNSSGVMSWRSCCGFSVK